MGRGVKRVLDMLYVNEVYHLVLSRYRLPRPRDPVVNFHDYAIEHQGVVRAFAVAAAVAQIAEYARTGRLSGARKGCTIDPALACGDARVWGSTIQNAPVRGHASFVAFRYWKRCFPVTLGPAARALVALGLATPSIQRYVEALLRVKETPMNTAPDIAKALRRHISDYGVYYEVHDAATAAAAAAWHSDAPLGPLAATLYVIAFMTGRKVYRSSWMPMQAVLADPDGRNSRLCSMVIEFCRHNIYVWTPVRRYRLPGSPAGVINTLTRALKETMRLCRGA